MIKKSYEIQKNLSSFLKYNLFLLYGENDGLKKEIKELIVETINKQDNNTEYLSIYEDEVLADNEKFYNSIYSGSLFSDKKIIILNNGTDKIINQIKEIENKFPKNIFIIIFADILEKKSKLRNFFETSLKTLCVACYADSDRDLEIIANNEFRKNNINIARESINLLIEKSNSNRSNLKNEIEKIKAFAINKKILKVDEIKSIINFSGEYKSDNFINECLCGNISQYKKSLTELYSNTINQIFLLRILSNKVKRLLAIKEKENDHKNIDNLISALKPPIFWKEKPIVKKQLTIWTLKNLKETINEINNIELLCKKYPQISKIIFFNFFNKICKKANNYSGSFL